MSKLGFAVGAAAAIAVAGSASALEITETAAQTRASLTSGLSPLNLTGQPIIGLDANPNGNVFTRNFVLDPGSGIPTYSGTLRAEVFGNQANPGPGLNEVTIVYTFTGNAFNPGTGANLTQIDAFEMGINTGVSLDYSAIATADHGRVTDEITPGQSTPRIDLFNNVGSNDTMLFNYNSNVLGPNPADGLGALQGQETFTWYVTVNTGAVAINVVDVTVTDAGALTTQTLAFVTNPGQDDLNVPAPGVLALAGAGLGLIARRRRH